MHNKLQCRGDHEYITGRANSPGIRVKLPITGISTEERFQLHLFRAPARRRRAIMEFRVLGPIELWSAGQQCDLGPTRVRCVLAILMLTPRTLVPTDALIDRVWDTQPPPKARESLSVYITRLRAALRQAIGDSIRLTGRDSGYELDIDPGTVDLHQFRRLRRQADALAADGDWGQAASLLREADRLWRGQAFAGIRGDWVGRMRDSLDEERRVAILKRIECELELGRHADLVGELRHLLAQYPLDEVFIAHQMTALYGSGRPGQALGLYRDIRSRLVEELGTEPGPLLADLHQRILRHDPSLAVRPVVRRPDRPAPPDTLPPATAEFVGRSQELSLLTGGHSLAPEHRPAPEHQPALDRGATPYHGPAPELSRFQTGAMPQISVIEGMAGVGKTALALHAARTVAGQYPDGTYYLNLHTHDPGHPALDAEEALDRLLRMLTAPATQLPDGFSERAALLRAQLSRRRAIVILDDAGQHDQIRPLLPEAGDCLILITTRRRFPGLEGARALTLDALPVDDAITLFRLVAGPGPAHDQGEAAMAVQLCGRLPLAIQLAAGRLAQDYPPRLGELVAELSQSPARSGGTSPASPEVMSAFDLAYRALEPAQQRFFRRLGMSPCAHISLGAAAALGGGTLADTQQALAALLDHHLLARAPAGQYRFHDLIRGYAATRAAQEDSRSERRQAVGRLLDYYLHSAADADQVLHPFRQRAPRPASDPPPADPPPAGPPAAGPPATGTALSTREDAARWLESEWRNILQAAQHAAEHEWKDKCADLAHALAGFMDIRAFWAEAIAAHTMALQASRDLDDPARIARASVELSEVSQQTGRYEVALPLAEDAAAIYRSLADRRGEADALDQAGVAHQRAGRSREALAYYHEARSLYEGTADTRGVATTLSHSGIASWWLGRYPDAEQQLRQALALYGDVGDRRGEAKTLNNLARVQLSLGLHRDALDGYEKSLKIFREIGGAQNQAILYHNIGAIYQYKSSYENGLAAYGHALAIYHDIGDLPNEAGVLNDIGALYQSAERYDEALTCHERAQSIAGQIGNLSQQVIALRGIAGVNRGSGRYGEAFDRYHTALRLAREIGDPYEEAKILEGIAETTLSTRRPDAARIVLRQALDIFERLGVPEAESARIRIEAIDPGFSRTA
jgi:tetratricopeptide (TPR) repeat protein